MSHPPPALDEISADRFKACEGQDFRIPTEDGEIALELAQVSSLKGDTPRKDRAPFSLLFYGPPNLQIEQQIVPLRNESFGELHLFLVPLGPDPDDPDRRMLFEAVFT